MKVGWSSSNSYGGGGGWRLEHQLGETLPNKLASLPALLPSQFNTFFQSELLSCELQKGWALDNKLSFDEKQNKTE